MTMLTPFEEDILEQPAALRRLVEAGPVPELAALGRRWERIVFTGMGSSHFASVPTWRTAVRAGHDAWRIDAGELLDTPGMLTPGPLTPGTLLVVTSQSGASGEVVELLDRLQTGELGAGFVVGVTAYPDSPLALRSDLYLPLHSGDEATVSTKSYLNTLAVHRRLAAVLAGEDLTLAEIEIAAAADDVEAQLERHVGDGFGARVLSAAHPRLAAIGKRDDAATALLAGLITKESSKVAIEGYVGGQFRHGPFELAGPGMTAFLYGAYESDADESTSRLAADLAASGADVILIGDIQLDGATTMRTPDGSSLSRLMTGAVVAEYIAVDLARANGVVPGAFAFGSKITTTL